MNCDQHLQSPFCIFHIFVLPNCSVRRRCDLVDKPLLLINSQFLQTVRWDFKPWPWGYKTSHAQLSWAWNFIMLMNIKMPTIVGIWKFISKINTTSERPKARNFFICQYFSFNELSKFRAQWSWVWKKFYNLRAWSQSPYDLSYWWEIKQKNAHSINSKFTKLPVQL